MNASRRYLLIMHDVCPPADGDLAKKYIAADVYQVIEVRYAVLRQDFTRIYHVYLSNGNVIKDNLSGKCSDSHTNMIYIVLLCHNPA